MGVSLVSTLAKRNAVECQKGDARPTLVARQAEEKVHDAKGKKVWHEGHEDQEFRKVLGRPRSLKVPAAIEEGEAADG